MVKIFLTYHLSTIWWSLVLISSVIPTIGLPSNVSTASTKIATPIINSICLWGDVEYSSRLYVTKGQEFNVSYPYDTYESLQWFVCSDSGNVLVGKCQNDYLGLRCEDVHSAAKFAYTTSLAILNRDVALVFKKLDRSIARLIVKCVRNEYYFSRFNRQWTVNLSGSYTFGDLQDYIIPTSISVSSLAVIILLTVIRYVYRRRRGRCPTSPAANLPTQTGANRPTQTEATRPTQAGTADRLARTSTADRVTQTEAARPPLRVDDDPPSYDALDHTGYLSTVIANNGFSDSFDSEPPPAYPGTHL